MKNPTTVLERGTLCFSSYENPKLKVKLWRVGARERKTRAFFVQFIFSEGNFFKICVFISLYSVLNIVYGNFNAQKMKFSIKDFFNKCNQIRSFLRIWSHLLKKSLMENFIFSAVKLLQCDNIRGNLREWRGKKGCQNLHKQSSLTLFFFWNPSTKFFKNLQNYVQRKRSELLFGNCFLCII